MTIVDLVVTVAAMVIWFFAALRLAERVGRWIDGR